MSILQIQNLSQIFGKNTVLDGFNLDVKEGDIFGLIGVNGVGKTTAIRAVVGLSKDWKGEIFIDGKSNLDDSSRSCLSFLPDSFRPSQHVTGYEFIKFALDIKGCEFDKEKADEIAYKLSLDPKYLKLKTSKCSRGTLQKIGLVSSFMPKSKVVILDEPMNGLDVFSRICLKKYIREYVAETNSAVLFSSHILGDIDEICNVISILHNKTCAFNGSPEEFRTKYQGSTTEESFMELTKNSISTTE